MATKKKHWLEGLEAGEEIRGYVIPDGGMTGQGLLVRVRTEGRCPHHSPNTNGVDFVDDALIDDVQMINLGLEAATDLEIVTEYGSEGERIFFDEDGVGHIDDWTSGGIRDRFNSGKLADEHGEKAHYIRFTVQQREEPREG